MFRYAFPLFFPLVLAFPIEAAEVNPDKIIALCNERLKQKPHSLEYLWLRLQAYDRKEDNFKILGEAKEIIGRLKPRDAEGFWLRGEVYRLRASARERIISKDPLQWFGKVIPGDDDDKEQSPRSTKTEPFPHPDLGGYGGGAIPRVSDPLDRIKADRFQAIADYTEVIRQDRTDLSIHAYRCRAQVYFDQNDFDKGIADLSAVVLKRPNDPTAFLDRADAYSAHGESLSAKEHGTTRESCQLDTARAIADYSQALSMQPTSAGIYLKRAWLYIRQGDNAKAITDCTDALRLEPKNELAYERRMIAYRNVKEYDRAIEDCTTRIRLNPHDTEQQKGLYSFRASMYEAKGDKQRALEDYTNRLRYCPTDAYAYMARGEFFQRTNDFDRALNDYEQGFQLASGDKRSQWFAAQFLGKQAHVLLCKGDVDAALVKYTQAIERDGSYNDLYLQRALVYLRRGEYRLFEEDARKAAEDYDRRGSRYLLRLVLLVALRDFQQIIDDNRSKKTDSSTDVEHPLLPGPGELPSFHFKDENRSKKTDSSPDVEYPWLPRPSVLPSPRFQPGLFPNPAQQTSSGE